MTISGDEKLLILVDRIYESVDRPELWPQTIRAIGELIGGKPHLWADDDDNRNVSDGPVIQGAPPSFGFRFYRTWVQGCHSTLLLSRSDLRQLAEYEREFGELIVRFFKIILLSILGSPSNVGGRESMMLSMARRFMNGFELTEGGRPELPASNSAPSKIIAALWEDGHIFAPETLRGMRLLMPHLDRAVRLQMRMTSAGLRADLVSGALDALTLGVVLVDAAGLPLWLNRRAHEIIDHSNTLRLGAAGLVAASRAENQSLRQLINDAISAGSQGLLAISRGVEFRPLLLIAIPLKSDEHEALADSPCCAIFISDPDRTDNPSVEALRHAFGLTYREAQTAIAVANGHGLKVAAKSMGVALTTARSQLQQAFEKTGTRQQAELAALVHRTLAQLRYDRPAADARRFSRSLSSEPR